MNVSRKFTISLAGCFAAILSCTTDQPQLGPDAASCITVRGEGQTVGDRNRLKGDGVFHFGEEERPVKVGLYLFEMREGEGGFHVDTQYQFNWANGDSFLTSDEVFFQPGLIPDEYNFEVRMEIVAGSGRFANMEGLKPITLKATITFGPPRSPGDALSASEQFDIDGRLCPI